MLILTRKVGEALMIGGDVIVTVLGISGNQVRIGVNAPREVPVHREEVYDRIHEVDPGDSHQMPTYDPAQVIAPPPANRTGRGGRSILRMGNRREH